MQSCRRGASLLLGLLLLAGNALADASIYDLPGLTGSYNAEPGLHLRSHEFTLPADLGTVTDVLVSCSGVYLPGETLDNQDQPHVWEAELTVFLQVGDESYWAVLEPDAGAFALQSMFVSPGGSPVASGRIVGGSVVTVDAVLLASGDDGRTIVRYPALNLTGATLEVHSAVANEGSTMSRLKALYR